MPKVLLKNRGSEIIWDQDRIDLNTDVSFIEIRKYRLSNKTLNTHEIVTGKRSSEVGARKVRSWSGVDTKEVECLYRYDKGKED